MSSIDMCHASNPRSTFDFEGLEESLVDNNEDDDDEDFNVPGLNDTTVGMIPDPSGSGVMFDHHLYLIRNALIRDSHQRTDEDIEIIVRFLSIINSNHDHLTRRRLAPHFVLAEIEARNTRVLTHGEKLDAYCIVAAGSLRHVLPSDDEILLQQTIGSSVDEMDNYMLSTDPNGLPQHLRDNSCPSSHHMHQNVRYLHVGDEFGAHLDDRVVYGEIFTNEDFVWVLCVPHSLFDQICGEKTFKTIRDEITGNIIEMRANCLLPGPADTNSLGSTNLTASDLSLSQSNDPSSKSLNYSLPDDYPPAPATVPNASSVPNASAIPPKSLALGSTKQSTVPSSDSNELIRATKDRLYELLLNTEPNETFIEDFLLTFRIWSEKELHPSKDSKIMTDLMNRICTNIRKSVYVENCVRIVLIWLVNHYQDFQFENNRYLLEEFENVLKENFAHKSQLRLFYMNLSAKSCERRVTVTRSDRNSPLPFSLIGGYECSARLFIGEILSNVASNQALPDLRPGDRVISINGDDCHSMKIGDAYNHCRASTHLSLQVKYDPHLFYALIEGRHETKRQIVETFPLNNRLSSSTSTTNFASSANLNNLSSNSSKDVKKEGGMWKQKVRSFVSNTTNQLINSTSNILNNNSNNNSNNSSIQQQLNNSLSNSSISSIPTTSSSSGFSSMQSQATHTRILSYEVPEIIKIYLFENNDCRFLPIHSSTTARECIQLAMREFQLTRDYSSLDFALYEYSVIFNNSNSANGAPDENSVASSTVIKRLSDKTSDLVNNLGINSRLYLKLLTQPKESTNGGNTLSDSDIAKEIIKDSSTNSLLTLDGSAIARELTARDFRLFCKIEAQQFVYDLAFNDPNSSQSNNQSSILFDRTRELQEFERKTNEEMFWTINQVLGEKRSLTKKVKAIKQLIRIATIAMKLNNYNTLFAILSGLMHLSVSRLKSCWDRVPAKHMKQLQKLQQLMDPSRNFYNFRQQLMQILRQDSGASIIIPFFPLVKKDLSFIWLANQTYVNSTEPQTPSTGSETKSPKTEMLVNWEKMRLLSEKIREIQKMANTTSLALAAVNGLGHSSGSTVTSPSVANEPIDPNLLFRIFADNVAAEDPRTFSHKKLWETQRMAKRVQSFLDETFSSISSDEHELMSRSYSCELPQTPNSSHATTRSSIASTMSSNSQMSHPSPTPSSASSSSNSLSMHSDGTPGSLLYRPQRPKFGQTSPKQLRKLLALSDGAVIVPHNNSGSNGTREHHNNTTGGGSSHHYHNHHSHHHHQYSQHNTSTRASNSSLNSNLSSSNSYYNSIYGCNPQYPMHPSRGTSSSNAYGNGNLTTNNYVPSSGSSNSKMTYSSMIDHHSIGHLNYSTNCCSMMPPCCTPAQSSSALYPNQPYCSCCTSGPMMRPSMLVMPQQQSGLIPPGCSCAPSQGSSRRQNSLPPKQSLPVESSSVTSLRRLEQYQQMTRQREIRQHSQQTQAGSSKHSSNSRRPQCPDYDTTMQRICGTTSMSINGMVPKSASSHHRGQNHREDIV